MNMKTFMTSVAASVVASVLISMYNKRQTTTTAA